MFSEKHENGVSRGERKGEDPSYDNTHVNPALCPSHLSPPFNSRFSMTFALFTYSLAFEFQYLIEIIWIELISSN